MPYAQSYTAGWQRALNRSTALEIRYVGTRFLQSFDRLQLQRDQHQGERVPRRVPPGAGQPAGEHQPGRRGCIGGVTTAGCQNNFAYTGAPGTAPLPIFARRLQRGARRPMPAIPRCTPARTGPTRPSSGSSRCINPNPGGFAQHQHDERSDWQQHVPAEPGHGRLSREPVHRQSRQDRRRVHPRQRRRHALRFAAGRTAAPVVEGLADRGQLRPRQADGTARGIRSAIPREFDARRRSASRRQGELDLRAAVRPWPALTAATSTASSID